MRKIFKYLNILSLRDISRRETIFKGRRAIASLPMILLLGGIIIEIGIAGAFLLIYLNNSLYGTRLANEALTAAHSGIAGGTLRVIVNKDCGADVTCPSTPYTLIVGRATAEVSICKDICPGLSAGQTSVTSLGRIFTKQHRLVAILNVSSTTGLVSTASIREIIQ